MRSKDTKTTFFSFLPYECGAAEEYLNVMAEKGWILESIKGAFFKFKKIEGKKIKYSVDVLHKISEFDHKDNDVALEYREYCKAAGWNYICQKGKIQVFYAEDYENAVSIHTDEEEKFKSVFKASLFSIVGQLLLILIFMFNIYIQLTMGNTEFLLASNIGILSMVAMVTVILINIIEFISFFLWIIRARAHLRNNKVMRYDSYRQIRRKNIFKTAYSLLLLFLLLKLTIFDNGPGRGINIFMVIMIFIPILVMLCAQRIIDRSKYSKGTNMAITAIGAIISICLMSSVVGSAIIGVISKNDHNEMPTKEVNLTLIDFGYKENNDGSTYISSDKSILAEKVSYSSGYDEKELNYTILKSKYPWVIKFHENRLLARLNKYGLGLKKENYKLNNNIALYSDTKKEHFVLIAEDKVVDIRKSLSKISDEEFFNIVYKKLLSIY